MKVAECRAPADAPILRGHPMLSGVTPGRPAAPGVPVVGADAFVLPAVIPGVPVPPPAAPTLLTPPAIVGEVVSPVLLPRVPTSATLQAGPAPRLSLDALPAHVDILPPAHVLVRMTGLQGELHARFLAAGESGAATDAGAAMRLGPNLMRVRAGMALVARDGSAAHAHKAGVPEQSIQSMAAALRSASSRLEPRELARELGRPEHMPLLLRPGMDVHALVQAVLRESYLQQSLILRDMALNVEQLNDLRKRIRRKLNEVRSMFARYSDGDALPEGFDFDLFNGSSFLDGEDAQQWLAQEEEASGAGVAEERGGAAASFLGDILASMRGPARSSRLGVVERMGNGSGERPALLDEAYWLPGWQSAARGAGADAPKPLPYNQQLMEQYAEALDEQLKQVGDDAQLANLDMQDALQRQQQSLQMMSNISKMLHETAMSIIRKIGG